MYYHVIVKPKSDKYYGEYKTDLTKEQLISRFVEPYEQGLPIIINGKTVQPEDLERITISESEKTIESFVAQVRLEHQRSSVAIIGGPSYEQQAIGRAKDVTDDFIEGAVGYKKALLKDAPARTLKASGERKRVFIVHGHDESAQNKAARFIEKLGFEAVILHEKASSGRTIIEKIEHYSDVGFAVVLYTPDDVGNVKSAADNLNLRARQNVVFEHGYLIGKLGRQNVVALVDGKLELPNDISGVVYISLDEASAWHLQLAKEMKQSGYDIDMNKLI
ncbi:nucleotide-binding protein [Pseudomonas sp. KHPS1]|uniref:TIR domain-containing protein n=1 Tax=Pseudomonas putida TaxID=303 RepID=UPI0020B7E03C|nr:MULTISPECIES: nucleotide-binding protein [Pseudomonas]MDD2003608.1 nucleotide-binding protein [Pseudomonas putida]UTH37248.1 nucleotide-binding protein [Pseudomonas sp. KHPS1]